MFERLNGLLQQVRQLSLFEEEAPQQRQQPAAPSPTVVDATKPAAGTTQRELLLDGQHVPYTLRRARRRSIGFSVSADGLAVAAPRWVSIAEIERALQLKAGWILRKLVEQREHARRQQAATIDWVDGCQLPYLGAPLTVRLAPLPGRHWLDAEQRHLHIALAPQAGAAPLRDAVQAWLQREARSHFEARCAHFAAALDVRYTRLSLSSARTRWGSASASGAIRLNWRLIHFEASVIDYVVAHELAHLREMNHSERFWAVVRSVVPEYEQARSRLREAVLPRF